MYERARGAETRMKEAIAERDALHQKLEAQVSAASEAASKAREALAEERKSDAAAIGARLAEEQAKAKAERARHQQLEGELQARVQALETRLAETSEAKVCGTASCVATRFTDDICAVSRIIYWNDSTGREVRHSSLLQYLKLTSLFVTLSL